MQLENSFTVPVPVDEAWRVLLDIERIAPCMPGAALDSVDGDDFTGRVKVKLGPINLTYQGKASFVEKDEAAHRAVIDARGKDQRGNGTAAAMVTANLRAEGSVTRVDVLTDLNITGRPAQFGRGVMTDVGNKLLGQFADKLAAQLGEGDAQGDADRASAAAGASTAGQATAGEGAAAKAAATATGVVEEVAASAEQAAGEGTAVKKAAAATKKAAASATDKVAGQESAEQESATADAPAKTTAAKATAAKATPAKKVPPAKGAAGKESATTGTPAKETAAKVTAAKAEHADTPSASRDTAPAGKAPSAPPKGTTAPPNRPATGAPLRSVPGTGPSTDRPRPAQTEPEPIDLLEVAGGAALSRYAAPAAGVTALLVLIMLLVRRRRR
ncbi:SRPBCC domain-containing protein [Blastococcus sp. VKM Ac-2987]|uniref:SRPBCC domain-containing protein n=1 Tax=Blastococcus sp. VKM Ac-2987 TaxID=3004141 RepID=UPI0022ABBC49|nr:SRPBCC domain-containing protein [Blastococcus sp. VKM Ac-2987]MCZ2858980.1 SRPBCC domain-containing protein [Blastococcus sp. VKM Ac-2987]